MNRAILPVMLCIAPLVAGAETLRLDPLTPKAPAQPVPSECRNIPNSQDNCVRVLACIGVTGLYFDGEVLGWDQGTVRGSTSENVACTGTWRSGGLFGTGSSQLTCSDGLTVDVLYYSQDPRTGTVIGRGMDSADRSIIAWSGKNVLKYLTPQGQPNGELPCGPTRIPLS